MATKKPTNSKEEFRLALSTDPKFKKFLRIVDNVKAKLNIEADKKEALMLLASRTSRSLHGKKAFSPTAIIDASLKDLSTRSRLVEIRVQATVHVSLLNEAIDAAKRHMSTEYYELLSEYKTVEQRRAMLDRAVKSALEIAIDAKSLVEMLDTIIKDIDSAGYALKSATECLKLMSETHGRVV